MYVVQTQEHKIKEKSIVFTQYNIFHFLRNWTSGRWQETYMIYLEYQCNLLDIVQTQPPEVFYKKALPKNFAIFTGKHLLCQSLFSIKFQPIKACKIIKKRLQHRCFPVHIAYYAQVFKDTHREKAPSNKTPALAKSTNMGIWVVAISNQLFIIRGS